MEVSSASTVTSGKRSIEIGCIGTAWHDDGIQASFTVFLQSLTEAALRGTINEQERFVKILVIVYIPILLVRYD